MADCERASIPDSLIESKGDFKCDNLYLPDASTLVGYRNDSNCLDNYTPDLSGTIPVTFDMTNIAYSDEYMSWQSEVFTVPDYVPPANPTNYTNISPACYGLCQTGAIGSPCITGGNEDNGYWTGQTFAFGDTYYGRTIQFFFNIYKRYCCTLDSHGDVIDYDYQYYWIKLQKLDGVLVLPDGCGCGEIDFCTSTFDIQPPTCPCLWGVRNF